MKCLFCYDGPLEVDSAGNHYGTVINDKVFKRYQSIADEINVAIRVDYTSTPNRKSLIQNKIVSVYQIENLSSLKGQLKKGKVKKKLSELINSVDFLIIRLPSFIGNECVEIAKKQKKPYIIEMVGCPWDSMWNYSIKGKIIAPFMWLTTKNNLSHSSHVIYVTNHFLQERYPTSGVYTCCSNVELPDQSLINSKKLGRYKNISANDTIVMGTCAAIDVPYKGQECVLHAVKLLVEKGFNIRYEMVGSGDSTHLRSIAKKLNIEQFVIFKGEMPHDDVFKWLEHVDIYIQPSKQEGLPRALIEAMNATCFCLGAQTGGIPELLPNYLIFSNKKNNYEEITDLVEKNIRNMESEAKKNYELSLQYEKSKIQKKRESFLARFSKEKLEL